MAKKFIITPPKPKEDSARWVDPAVSAAVIDNWIEDHPVILYADGGTRPVTFKTPDELRRATKLPEFVEITVNLNE